MGGPMASRLAASGFATTGYDINPAAMERLGQAGGQTASSAAEAAAGADILITIVASAQQVEEVLFGDTGALTTLPPGSPIMVCSTVPPDYMQDLGRRLQARGFNSSMRRSAVVSPGRPTVPLPSWLQALLRPLRPASHCLPF